jgi:hypothetical protein
MFHRPSFAVCAAILVFFTASSSSRAGTAVQTDQTAVLTSALRSAISQAPSNFGAWRKGVNKADAYGVAYKPTASMRQQCPTCVVKDEFATADTDERYAVTFYWDVSKSWSRAQTLAYIQRNIGGLMPNYKMEQGTNSDGDNWFYWAKGAPVQFVYVRTFTNANFSGFEVRIARYLPKNLHYVPYAVLSSTQRTDLANAVKNYVQLGVQNATTNFYTLRGKASDKNNNYFDTNVSFGEYMASCSVDGIFSDLTGAGTTAKWILECNTPTLGGAKSNIEEIIRSAVSTALPSGFSLTTDPVYASLSDFRWDRYADLISVEIMSIDNNDGTFTYHVQIYHFLS